MKPKTQRMVAGLAVGAFLFAATLAAGLWRASAMGKADRIRMR